MKQELSYILLKNYLFSHIKCEASRHVYCRAVAGYMHRGQM